jgi:hypothetical protein
MEQDNVTRLHPGTGMALLPPSIAELDLTNLPERLDDAILAKLKILAEAPLPDLPTCDERHFAKCLRVMLAVLPKQATDAIGGELFVEAYRRQLAQWPREAISYLADRATATCRWFPTIAECREILTGWRRNDEAVWRRSHARSLINGEMTRRRVDDIPEPQAQPLSREQIARMPQSLIQIGLKKGWLAHDDDGELIDTGQECDGA